MEYADIKRIEKYVVNWFNWWIKRR